MPLPPRKPVQVRVVRVVAAGTEEEERQAWREVSLILWRALASKDRPIRLRPRPGPRRTENAG